MRTKFIINSDRIFFVILLLAFSFLILKSGYSQKNVINNNPGSSDYRILNSTESFIEIEFYPSYVSETDFVNSISNNSLYGSPDVKIRSFPLYFPGSTGNRAEIIDSKYD